ncbi:isocitrate lyase/phosphoenolpyruvate mutase family protein [Rummeliibacillus pycnus]|uniref:isocitrate lyase/phosphoenolpyruvate mutase family protein n=1 Tax=Rummeliibacillus pycnus TaxID=101070 RepID=UPI0037C9250D
MGKSIILRKLLQGDNVLKVAGAHDGLSAKIAENKGFDAIWASGLGISAVETVPDASILSMQEFLNAAISMNQATDIPVIADCDSGFGNIPNVVHMVKKYESAGIAGVCIEDKVFPKLNSFLGGNQQRLISVEEFTSKIRAAKGTQIDPNFVVIARVESLIAGESMEDALYRASCYLDAGADAILIHSKSKTSDEIEEFSKKWSGEVPLFIVPTMYPHISIKNVEKMGIKAVVYANQAIRASVKMMDYVLGNIIEKGTSLEIEGEISNVEEIFSLQNVNQMKLDEEKFSKSTVRS